ncbi:S8 family serine peptidase [Luedemannella helvata]|uniref:S8 family serine peptidase n=1 Tax=Luedemannella helvata TaxID=349315 RepID=A0ABP4VZ36_9ACTN
MTGRRLLRTGGIAATVGVLAVTVALPAQPAHAAGCEPARVVREVPWAQRMLAPERVWPLSTGDGVTVAVLDSAVDTSHPQLRGRVSALVNYLGAPPTSCVPHGTSVASIINASRMADVGFQGLAPQARVLPVRVTDRGPDGAGQAADVTAFATAIRTAASRARVINISLVMRQDDPRVRAAIEDAIKADVVVVAAAGNGHPTNAGDTTVDPPVYPAAYPGVLGVGAINEDGTRLPESQVGAYVDIVAPGGKVLAATPGSGHIEVSGTSYAAPFVAATVALVRSARPQLSGPEVVNRIIATATPARNGPGFGAGIVDPYRAVTEEALFGGQAATLPGASVNQVDPVRQARTEHWQRLGHVSLLIGGLGLALVTALAFSAWLIRGGRRLRWRPTRASRPE